MLMIENDNKRRLKKTGRKHEVQSKQLNLEFQERYERVMKKLLSFSLVTPVGNIGEF